MAEHGRLTLLAGLGGGTGSGAAPVIAELARDQGLFCLAAVFLPFTFESRQTVARQSLRKLAGLADEMAVIDLNRYLMPDSRRLPLSHLIQQADRALFDQVWRILEKRQAP